MNGGIDLTIMCDFFLEIYTLSNQNNDLILNNAGGF